MATLSSGTQSNVNATFYRNQLIQAINKTLDSERALIRDKLAADRARDIESYTVDDMIVAVNAYHQACSFERGLQVLLDKALDKSGAEAVLASRSREAATTELDHLINTLDLRIATLGDGEANKAEVDALRKQQADAEARRNGLVLKRTEKLLASPSAGDTSEKHEPKPAETPDDAKKAPEPKEE